ncbi:hypothetical protein GCM10023321_61620 [Pseudonocardia eucalypti]|uniref:UPF0235 protein GCM10023321_61620 n=1 Tax=Pseudonocardia eucalypti TaxID=648755 RepID=A0ABP9QVU1_9PSEU|nr:uncharacterized protein YggU (UPF0235/DUF167 family) [Pseudonocardia eucalypti]
MKIAVRVRPGAKADRVGGRWDGPRGGALLVSVRARAVDGRANDAVVGSLAGAFELRRSDVAIVSGHRGRDKVVELDGDPEALRTRLELLLAS